MVVFVRSVFVRLWFRSTCLFWILIVHICSTRFHSRAVPFSCVLFGDLNPAHEILHFLGTSVLCFARCFYSFILFWNKDKCRSVNISLLKKTCHGFDSFIIRAILFSYILSLFLYVCACTLTMLTMLAVLAVLHFSGYDNHGVRVKLSC